MVKTTLEAVQDDHLHECTVLVVPRHEVADELVVRHVFNVVHVSLKFVFLNASSRMFLLIMSALNHALDERTFETTAVGLSEGKSFVLCHGLRDWRYSISSSWIRKEVAF